jgi:SAM-dependent methyltransferase
MSAPEFAGVDVSSVEDLVPALRSRIQAGTLGPVVFRALLHRLALPSEAETWHDPPRYDHLDRVLDGILQIAAPPPPRMELSPEMIPYQATPARILLDMAERLELAPDDVFYDLGSGLGRVVLGMALMSMGHIKGVEIEPAYAEYARERAADLNFRQVSFVEADARFVDYADGTVFFLYTPFKGTTLRHVLSLLRAHSRTRPIRVCTYGPGTLEVQDQDWLRSDDDPERDIHYVTIFDSIRPRHRRPPTRRRRR